MLCLNAFLLCTCTFFKLLPFWLWCCARVLAYVYRTICGQTTEFTSSLPVGVLLSKWSPGKDADGPLHAEEPAARGFGASTSQTLNTHSSNNHESQTWNHWNSCSFGGFAPLPRFDDESNPGREDVGGPWDYPGSHVGSFTQYSTPAGATSDVHPVRHLLGGVQLLLMAPSTFSELHTNLHKGST